MTNQDVISLRYDLAELPSAQHRAGLAGLVLMIEEVKYLGKLEEQENAILDFELPDNTNQSIKAKKYEYGGIFRFNLEGLKVLFNVTYDSFKEHRWSKQKDKRKEYIEDEIKDFPEKDKKGNLKKDKDGNIKTVTKYRYDVVIPSGAFLDDEDESEKQLWIKLWRDMMWNIVRDKPASRSPFNERGNENYTYSKDAEKVWQGLQNPDKNIGQSGTYYLGAAASTAENIPTKDISRYQFLLHFAPFVFQVYCPATLNKEGERQFNSYAIIIPDVANLKRFCFFFPKLLRNRDNTQFRYLPRQAIIDLAQEGALDFFCLQDKLGIDIGNQKIKESILGAEVIHAEKIGNSLKFHGIYYIEPTDNLIKNYDFIRDKYWCPWFRKQRLINLINAELFKDNESFQIQPWTDFDDLLSRVPAKWIDEPEKDKNYLSHDARIFFNDEILPNKGENQVNNKTNKTREYAEIIYQVCQSYVYKKLKSKYDLDWKECKGNSNKEKDYNDKKTKVANEAFLTVRSRSESQAFIDYFVSTLYPSIKKEEFAQFAEDLFNKTDEIRALTLLALSSQFSSTKKDEDQEKAA